MLTMDPPPPCSSICATSDAKAQNDALEVDGQDAIPFLLVELDDRVRVGGDRGIVDRAIQPPVALDRGADHGRRVGGARHVRTAERRGAPVLPDALRRRLAGLRADVAHEHVGSGGGERASGRLAHAHRRPGDDRDLAV